jgi:hypothetical protein
MGMCSVCRRCSLESDHISWPVTVSYCSCDSNFLAVLPDDIFSYQIFLFGYIWEGLRMENVGKFLVHLKYFRAICYILWPFGIFYVTLVCYMANIYIVWPFGIFYGHLVNFKAIWYFLLSFIIFFAFCNNWQPCFRIEFYSIDVGRWAKEKAFEFEAFGLTKQLIYNELGSIATKKNSPV